jgi:carbamoyltransferase
MTIACAVKPITKREYPGITHIDGSARPQILRKEDNPFLHKVLMRAGELGGRDIFVNTSFNLHEEPIIANATEAITSFKKANLDYLVLNGKIYQQ